MCKVYLIEQRNKFYSYKYVEYSFHSFNSQIFQSYALLLSLILTPNKVLSALPGVKLMFLSQDSILVFYLKRF